MNQRKLWVIGISYSCLHGRFLKNEAGNAGVPIE